MFHLHTTSRMHDQLDFNECPRVRIASSSQNFAHADLIREVVQRSLTNDFAEVTEQADHFNFFPLEYDWSNKPTGTEGSTCSSRQVLHLTDGSSFRTPLMLIQRYDPQVIAITL